jgi:hypothetical protein
LVVELWQVGPVSLVVLGMVDSVDQIRGVVALRVPTDRGRAVHPARRVENDIP